MDKAGKGGNPPGFPSGKLTVKYPYPNNLTSVTAADFEEKVLKSSVPVLVDFWGSHCAPCTAMIPVLNAAVDKLSGKVVIVQACLDDNPQFSDRFKITGIPCFILFRDGHEIARHVGQKSESDLLKWIAGTDSAENKED